MEDTIVFYPSPELSHLLPMVELGKLILTHHPSLSITFIISTPPFETRSTAPYIASVSATNPSITFHHLPPISLPTTATATAAGSNPANLKVQIFEFARLNNDNLHQALLNLSKSSNLKALIIDFFCHAAAQVSSDLNIPTYYYHTGGASGLAAFLYFPTIHKNTTKNLKDIDTVLNIPGLAPFPAKDMPVPMLDRTRKIYECFLDTAIQMPKSAGIIVNTVEGLEKKAFEAITDGKCTPEGSVPPIYCVGPLFFTDESSKMGKNECECLSWLALQPKRSVLFLTFGGMWKFSTHQLREIAIGLEKSAVRFLWVVRYPPADDETMRALADSEPSLDLLLPEGFLERTKERGLVVKGWAPQVDVLNHDSVGGFVTNCGWISFLESTFAGVPMLCWPLYADQKLCRVVLVEELKVGLPLSMTTEGFVTAEELEKRVRELMETVKGGAIGEQIIIVKDAMTAATSEHGSSRAALASLVQSFKQV